jgi:hypothetical protein
VDCSSLCRLGLLILPRLCIIYHVCITLFFLSHTCLLGQPNYRLHTIHAIPSLKVLDYNKVTAKERAQASQLTADNTTGTAQTTESDTANAPVELTDDQREQIKQLLAQASSVQEIQEIEASLRKGMLPAMLLNKQAPSAPQT